MNLRISLNVKRINTKKTTPRHIVIKLLSRLTSEHTVRKKILNSARGKQHVALNEDKNESDLSSESMQTRR